MLDMKMELQKKYLIRKSKGIALLLFYHSEFFRYKYGVLPQMDLNLEIK